MSEAYRPSNGDEGEWFMSKWCERCTRDAANRADPDSGEGCRIIVYTMAYDVDEPEYPKEWVIKDGAPCCTAFDEEPTP